MDDLNYLSLPRRLVFLYPGVRIVRLIASRGRQWLGTAPENLAIFEATPEEVIMQMLILAQAGDEDVVYDIGCGDGRAVILAAKSFGAHAVGIDIDSRNIEVAKKNARLAGVETRTRFLCADARSVDVSQATVVILWLTGAGNLALRPYLCEQLRVGARIVSRGHDMAEWIPDKTEVVRDRQGVLSSLYLWRISETTRL